MSTKLGVHITTGSKNGYGPVAEEAPAVVLSMGDGAPLKEAWDKSGGRTITIFRDIKVYEDGNAPPNLPQMTEAEARAAADHYWPKLRAVYEANPADYYQPTNEVGGGLNEKKGTPEFEEAMRSVRNLIAYETRLMELSEADGGHIKLAIASLAGGSPGNFEIWKTHFVPHIRRAGEGGHIYSRHAYGPGLLTRPGPEPTGGNAGRPFIEAAYLRQHGIHTPMVITEAGPNAGYQFPGVTLFMEDVKRYDQLCQQHANIWGFCCWTYGNWQGATPKKDDPDLVAEGVAIDGKPNIERASEQLAAYLHQQGGAVRPQYPAVVVTGGPPPQAEPPAPADDWQPPSEPVKKGWLWVKRIERNGDLGRVHTNRLNLREQPNDVSAQVLGLVPVGAVVRITGETRAEGNGPVYYPVEVSESALITTGAVTPSSSEAPQPPAAEPTGQTIDILPYMIGDAAELGGKGTLYEVRAEQGKKKGEQERYQVQLEGNRVYITKHSQWEEWAYDDNWIYLGRDCSPGEAPEDAERPGKLRWYHQWEDGVVIDGQRFSRMWPRRMRVGQTWEQPVNHHVQFYYKSDGAKSAANSGTARNRATLFAHHPEMEINGRVFHDVIEIGREGGERHYFGGGLGRLGWDAPWGRSRVSEVHAPGARPDNVREKLAAPQ